LNETRTLKIHELPIYLISSKGKNTTNNEQIFYGHNPKTKIFEHTHIK